MSEKIPVYDNILEKQPLYYHGPVERIIDECPSCHSQTLFVGKGGYLTCGCIGCSEPGIGRAMLELRSSIDAALARATLAEQALEAKHDAADNARWKALTLKRRSEAEIAALTALFLDEKRWQREQAKKAGLFAEAEPA